MEGQITIFSLNEFERLVNTIPQTDPRTRDYSQLLENIERYGAIASTIDDLLGVLAKAKGIMQKEIASDPEPDQSPVSNVIPFPQATVNEIKEDHAPVIDEIKPAADEVKEEPKPDQAQQKCDEAQVTYDITEVRAELARLRASRPDFAIPEFLKQHFGVSGLMAVPPEKYPELMAAAKAL